MNKIKGPMNIKIEIHMIQSFGPSCLNRGEDGMPKMAELGLIERGKISAQCQKRAIRMNFNAGTSLRTKKIPREIIEGLIKQGKNEKEATTGVNKAIKYLGFGEIDKTKQETTSTLFIDKNVIPELTDILLNNWDLFTTKSLGEKAKKLLDSLAKDIESNLTADVALFGRMVATRTDFSVEAACYMAPAISTHMYNSRPDYFAAPEELRRKGEPGSAHIGERFETSPCYYRYSVVDPFLLLENLKNKTFCLEAIKDYLNSCIVSVPSGMQTNYAAFTRPDFIMIILTELQPFNYVNAFEEPVVRDARFKGLINESIGKLDEYFKHVVNGYAMQDGIEVHYFTIGERPTEYINTIATSHETVKELIDTIGDRLHEVYSAAS